VGVLYFTTLYLPTGYTFPKEKTQRVNLYALGREFASRFPTASAPKGEGAPTSAPLPSPLEVGGFVNLGGKIALILRAGSKTLVVSTKKETEGWRVLRLEGDKVVLSYGGREVKLPLPKGENNPRREAAAKNFYKNKESGVRVVPRELVRRLISNYGELLRGVDFAPAVENGQTVGFRIRYLSPSNVFYRLGFRRGDIIVSVNGVRLQNTDDLFRVLQIVQNEPTIRVELIRNGKPTELNIRIE